MVSSSFSHIEKLGLRGNQIQHIIGHQPVIQQQISTLNYSHSLESEKLRVPRSGPHQEHIPWHTLSSTALPLTLPLLPQHLQQLLQLRQLQGYIFLPHGSRVARGRKRHRLIILVHPLIPLVPL